MRRPKAMDTIFSQLGWQSQETGPAQTGPPQFGSDIPYAPDLFGHDEESEIPVVDTGATSHDTQTPVIPQRVSVRRKGGNSTDNSASAPKRSRGLVFGRKVDEMCKSLRSRIPVKFDDFNNGILGKKLSILTATQVGKIIRGRVRMSAPNLESLPDGEKFKVVRELSLHFNLEQRRELLDTIDAQASEIYRRWKHELHKFYKEHDRSTVPEEFERRKDEWEWLVKHFESPEYQRRSNANKSNREKKVYHHGSSSCKIINIAKEHRDKGSKHPHIDAAVSAYFKPGRSDDIASQRVMRMKELASEAITEAQSQNPDIPIEQLSPLTLDTKILITDGVWGRRAGKEVRALGPAVHRELSQDSCSTRRSRGAETDHEL